MGDSTRPVCILLRSDDNPESSSLSVNSDAERIQLMRSIHGVGKEFVDIFTRFFVDKEREGISWPLLLLPFPSKTKVTSRRHGWRLHLLNCRETEFL